MAYPAGITLESLASASPATFELACTRSDPKRRVGAVMGLPKCTDREDYENPAH
jgi:hypothetical protein